MTGRMDPESALWVSFPHLVFELAMPSKSSPEPLSFTLADFLCEADGPTLWLSQHFDDYIHDIDSTFDARKVVSVAHQPRYGLVEAQDGHSALLVHRSETASSWKGAEVVGYYNPPGAVCLQDAHQGQGLGAELILWTALHLSFGAPTAGLDEQCFSESGYAAHQAAWRLGVQRGLIVDPEAPVTPLNAEPRRRRRP
jgi:hypothetical protein